MRYNLDLTIIALGVQMLASAAAANGPEIDSREYKLMLEPLHFVGDAPEDAVSQFVREQLEPAVR